MPYMGNIQTEVCPISFLFFFRSDPKEVNKISMHHPVSPQIKKFFLMEKVCPRPLLFIQAMTYNKKYAFFGGVEIQMALYANIIIDISHEKLDRPFQYRVPEELKPC